MKRSGRRAGRTMASCRAALASASPTMSSKATPGEESSTSSRIVVASFLSTPFSAPVPSFPPPPPPELAPPPPSPPPAPFAPVCAPGPCPGRPGAAGARTGAETGALGGGRAGGCIGATAACGAPGGAAAAGSGSSRPATRPLSDETQPASARPVAGGGAAGGGAAGGDTARHFCSWTRRSQSLKRSRHLCACAAHCHVTQAPSARVSAVSPDAHTLPATTTRTAHLVS